MLKPHKMIQNCTKIPENQHVPDTFTLLSWNIYKTNHKFPGIFNYFIRRIDHHYAINFYCLQEAKYLDSNFFPLPGFSLHFAANLQLKSHAYGVMTVSNIYSHYAESILSKKTEFLFKTHKSSLASHYTFHDKTPLIIINVHAINFKNARIYAEEIKQLHNYIQPFSNTAMIVAGDFNCWNKRRRHLIYHFCESLGLTLVHFENQHRIKKFAKHPLDLVMYKNLDCQLAVAIDSHRISDHNPLLLRFAKLQ